MDASALVAMTLALTATWPRTDEGYSPPPRSTRVRKKGRSVNRNKEENTVVLYGNKDEGEQIIDFRLFGN
jgi:hypothetical protein